MFTRLRRWLTDDPGANSMAAPEPCAPVEEPAAPTPATPPARLPRPAMAYDESLLERARLQWRQGDWESLISLHLTAIEHHPDRAKLGLIIASAWLQCGDEATARHYLRQAFDWGCDRRLAARILAAGVHNSLACAAAINQDEERRDQHFREAVVGSGIQTGRGGLGRLHAEMNRLGITNDRTRKYVEAAAVTTANSQSGESDFYRRFEDRFRGPREGIKRRLGVYLPFLQPIAERHSGITALDLGCGRGEWLELLKESGIDAQGVDQDAGMLEACHEQGLTAFKGDLLDYLRKQPSASRICVSLIHVVEHVPFEALLHIVNEAKRVLVPDGLLIMETPNPENYTVGCWKFYLDPSHRQPLPPPLLAFVPEYYGFQRIKVLRLQEAPDIYEKTSFTIADYLLGISPDYSVLAQPNTSIMIRNCADQTGDIAWSKEYGISLDFMLKMTDVGLIS